jgi:hypothetical protein
VDSGAEQATPAAKGKKAKAAEVDAG